MDRLTNVIQDGPISVLTLKRAESGNVTVWREWSQCQDPDIEAALHRLAKYEDSGLTPEQVRLLTRLHEITHELTDSMEDDPEGEA